MPTLLPRPRRPVVEALLALADITLIAAFVAAVCILGIVLEAAPQKSTCVAPAAAPSSPVAALSGQGR